MDAIPDTTESPHEPAPGTLGEVLYAGSRGPRVPEEEWVALVRAIAAGQQPALQALYARTHRIVFTLIMRISKDRETAEELTLDVFHDVWRRAPGYEAEGGSVLGWIMNQARSRAIDRLRFDQRKKRVHPDDAHSTAFAPDAAPSSPHAAVDFADRCRMLRDALTALTPEEREAIQTAYFHGLTYAETAQRLKQPLGTIKTRVRSGLGKLRKALGSEENEA